MIKLSKKSKLWAGISIFVTLLLGGLLWIYFSDRSTKIINEDPQSVMVSKACFGPIVKYINTIGTLVPNDSVELKSEVSAKIDKILFKEGALVKKGALLIQFDESLAKAELVDAEARYRKAKTEYEALDKLADRGAASKINRSKALAEMEVGAANVNSAKTKLEKHKVFAPFGGRIGINNLSEGQFIQMGGDLIKIVDYHPLKVDFAVAEKDIDKVYVPQEISLFVGGDELQEYKAKICAIEPESDRINHSFKVRAILEVPEDIAVNSEILKPGRFVKVRIAIDEDQQGIIIPESAIEKSGNEDIVFIVSDGMAMRRVVTVGMRKDGNVEIITGINEGDLVITKGQQGVSDGRAVIIRENFSTSEVVNAFREYYKKHPKLKKK